MKTLHISKVPRIIKNRKRLEQELDVKISNQGTEVQISGKSENEFVAEQVLEALNIGFPYGVAMLIKQEDLMFEIINIKDHTKRKDLSIIRGRIIGTNGKTLKVLSDVSECFLELDAKNNRVGIIGDPEKMPSTHTAITSLIKGAKTGNIYAYLEKHHPPKIFDLGLKK